MINIIGMTMNKDIRYTRIIVLNRIFVCRFLFKVFPCLFITSKHIILFISMIYWRFFDIFLVPKGIRTPVAAVKGQCPRPLDDGDLTVSKYYTEIFNKKIIL